MGAQRHHRHHHQHRRHHDQRHRISTATRRRACRGWCRNFRRRAALPSWPAGSPARACRNAAHCGAGPLAAAAARPDLTFLGACTVCSRAQARPATNRTSRPGAPSCQRQHRALARRPTACTSPTTASRTWRPAAGSPSRCTAARAGSCTPRSRRRGRRSGGATCRAPVRTLALPSPHPGQPCARARAATAAVCASLCSPAAGFLRGFCFPGSVALCGAIYALKCSLSLWVLACACAAAPPRVPSPFSHLTRTPPHSSWNPWTVLRVLLATLSICPCALCRVAVASTHYGVHLSHGRALLCEFGKVGQWPLKRGVLVCPTLAHCLPPVVCKRNESSPERQTHTRQQRPQWQTPPQAWQCVSGGRQ